MNDLKLCCNCVVHAGAIHMALSQSLVHEEHHYEAWNTMEFLGFPGKIPGFPLESQLHSARV